MKVNDNQEFNLTEGGVDKGYRKNAHFMTLYDFFEETGILNCDGDANVEKSRKTFFSPVVIEIEGKHYNIEVEVGHRKVILRPANEFLL